MNVNDKVKGNYVVLTPKKGVKTPAEDIIGYMEEHPETPQTYMLDLLSVKPTNLKGALPNLLEYTFAEKIAGCAICVAPKSMEFATKTLTGIYSPDVPRESGLWPIIVNKQTKNAFLSA